MLQHFLHLKEDNDYLQKAVADHASRQVLRAHAQYPGAKNKFGEAVELPDVEPLDGAELAAEDDAARRGLSNELVWVQDEVIKYLCADYNVTSRQTANGVAELADHLQDYGFTKAELLQACNLAPQSQVGLYLVGLGKGEDADGARLLRSPRRASSSRTTRRSTRSSTTSLRPRCLPSRQRSCGRTSRPRSTRKLVSWATPGIVANQLTLQPKTSSTTRQSTTRRRMTTRRSTSTRPSGDLGGKAASTTRRTPRWSRRGARCAYSL